MDTRIQQLQGHLGHHVPGPAQSFGGVTLVPLSGRHGAEPQYVPLADAIARGQAEVAELMPPQVNALQVSNGGTLPVFIMDGEEFVGGGQNRVSNGSVLVPAGAKIELPVSCVEQRRWSGFAAEFSSEGNAPSNLRRRKAETMRWAPGERPLQAEQGTVWAEVDEVHAALGVASSTAALRDAYLARAQGIADYLAAFPRPEAAVGVVVAIGGVCLIADLFDHPATLAAYWERLVRSYALDALGQPPAAVDARAATDFLAQATAARMTVSPAVGLGKYVRLDGDAVVGVALAYQGSFPHVGIYRRTEAAPGQTVGSRIERASQRGQRHSGRGGM